MKPLLWTLAVGLTLTCAACTCQPLVDPPDAGGAGGGTATGGGSATGGGTGAGGGTAADAGSFTDFVKAIIASDTTETATPRPASEFQNLPDDHAATFPGYFP
jgi:hypothetical protein